MASSDLSLWAPVAGTTFINQGPRRTIFEPAISHPRRFYRIGVQRQ